MVDKIANKSISFYCPLIRQGRYWQIAKHTFLVEWKGIKMRSINIYLGNLVRIWGKIFSTDLVLDTFYVKNEINEMSFIPPFLRYNSTN